jgi:phosphatidylglycerophosphatase C
MGFIGYSLGWSRHPVRLGDVRTVPTPIVAAFDLDGTLSDGGSVFKWLRYLRGSRAAYAASTRLALPLLIGAIRSGPWADGAKERLFGSLLRGLEESEVRASSREFALRHFEDHGRAKVLDRLRWHLREGHSVVIVSASPQIYVDVVVEMFDADGGLGTRLAVDARGTLTGSYLGKNCRGREKARRLSEWTHERFPDIEPTIYAYGNSRGDRRLLRAATYPFDAGRLGPLGALRHFPRLKSEEIASPTAGE